MVNGQHRKMTAAVRAAYEHYAVVEQRKGAGVAIAEFDAWLDDIRSEAAQNS